MSHTPDLRVIPISEIRVNPVALREVDKENEQYLNLVADVGRRGVLNAITVTEKTDEATQETFFQIVDGLHRYSAATDNALESLPVNVLSISDADIVETQIVANVCKVDTKPIEYTNALKRMLVANPTMTISDLAEKISQSTTYVLQRLSLSKLDGPIQQLVDAGEIKLANAYTLAKLPKEHQHEWLDAAITQQPSEFTPSVNNRLKEIKEAAKAGREAGVAKFEAVARLRKLAELKDEETKPSVGPALTAQFGSTTAAEGFALGIKWALNLDPLSVASAEAKYNEQKKSREEERKRLAAIREAKKQKEAAAKAEKARAESGLSEEEIEAQLAEQAEEVTAAAE